MDGVNITVPDSSLELIIKNYCRESGVRNLEKHIERLVHQLAFDYVVSKELENSQNELLADVEKVVPAVAAAVADSVDAIAVTSEDLLTKKGDTHNNNSGSGSGVGNGEWAFDF